MLTLTAALTADVVIGDVDAKVAMTAFSGIGRMLKLAELRLKYGGTANGKAARSQDLLAA